MSASAWLVGAFARLYPWPVEPSKTLRDAFAFLDSGVTPEAVVRAGYGAGLVAGGTVTLVVAVVTGVSGVLALGAFVPVALCVTHFVHVAPRLAATARRTSALGAAPDLVARAVLSMRLEPTPERAAEFAARTGDGPLAASLGEHVSQSHNTARAGLAAFGDAWNDLFPSLRRSCSLITVAGETPASDRSRLLERALAAVLDGTRDRLESFAARIRAPVAALYAFGVLLPTALVALLPAGGAAGVYITPPVVILLYNLLLPAALVGASVWLVARRPVAFPPPEVSRTHPEVSDTRRLAVLAGTVAAGAGWLVTARLFPSWGPPIAALGLGPGTALVVATRPVIALYDRVRAVEEGLSDALELVGRRVANGQAVEAAIEGVAGELAGPTADVLEDGARQQRQLHVGVREAFLGRHGVLETVPSRRVRGSVALLSLAAREGRPAGTALLALAEHVDDLQRIEREARRELATVCRTLSNTAILFGPMVAGATVALAGAIGGETELAAGEGFHWLGGPVGVYVLSLAAVLTALSVGLRQGFDRSLVGYRIGRALVTATGTYLAAYLFAGGLL